jgi:hypothetical protein
MGKVIDHVSRQTLGPIRPTRRISRNRSPQLAVQQQLACSATRSRVFPDTDKCTDVSGSSSLSDRNALPEGIEHSVRFQHLPAAGNQAYSCQSHAFQHWVPSDCTLPVIGTLPDHFAESVRLARNSQYSDHPASESQFRATWMLQDAAVVANCNTYNRNQPVRELRKGLFFRGRRHGAGIDSTSESFRTAFHTIYDLTGIRTTGDCRVHANQISDNPRHAPSVQC